MGRLIDADVLREEVYSWGMNDYEPSDFTDAIDNVPTVEAILKFDYENRLKADLKAILVELQLEIEEVSEVNDYDFRIYKEGIDDCMKIIQAKINELKAESEGKK